MTCAASVPGRFILIAVKLFQSTFGGGVFTGIAAKMKDRPRGNHLVVGDRH